MKKINCERCGFRHKVDDDILVLRKCAICQDIKFERSYFIQIEHQVIENYLRFRGTILGSIVKNLYLFGSYVGKDAECGDIDFLITYNHKKLLAYMKQLMAQFQFQFSTFARNGFSLGDLDRLLRKSIWDFFQEKLE